MLDLEGKAIVVTGASGALGSATVRAACEAGATVTLIDRGPAASYGLSSRAFAIGDVDLTRADDAQRAIASAHEKMQGIDVLVNIAGAFRWQTIADGDASGWDQLYAVNLKTTLNACKAAIPFLQSSQGGRIINIGANGALKAGKGMGAYAASKSAVHRLTESLAEELKNDGITVNALLPSIIDTPANRRDLPDADFSAWVSPDALAKVILFIASSTSQPITGALIPVTGRV